MKFLNIKLLFILVTTSLSTAIYAQQDSIALSLNQAVNVAIENNTEISIAQHSIESAKFAKKEAVGSFLPKLYLSTNYFRNINRPVIFLPDIFDMGNTATKLGALNDYNASLNVAVPVYSNQNQHNKKLADKRLDYQRETARYARQQVINATKKAYFNYLIAQEIVEVQEKQLENAEEILVDIKKRRRLGTTTDHDLTAAKVQVSQAKNSLLEAQNNIMPLGNALKLLLNLEPEDKLKLTEPIAVIQEELVVDQDLNAMLEDNSVLKQLALEIEMNENQIGMEKSAYYPTLEAIGNYNFQAQENGFDVAHYDWVNTSMVGLQLQFSIFNGNITKNRVKQAKINQTIAEEEKKHTSKDYQMQLQELISKLDFASKKINVQQESMELTEEALGLARKRYDFGVGTFLEVNDSVLSFTQARLTWLQAISEYKIAYYDYQLLLGKD